MDDLNSRCAKTLQKAMAQDFQGLYVVGEIEEFSDTDLKACDYRISVTGGKVYLVECPYPPHDEPANWLGQDISAGMNQAVSPGQGRLPFYFGVGYTFPYYRNRFECFESHEMGKTPDGVIRSRVRPTRPRNYLSPIVFETAFRNEPFKLLVQEGANWLGPTTDIVYVILIKVIENSSGSDVDAIRIIVMKRVGPLASESVFQQQWGCITFPWDAMDPLQFSPERWPELSAVEVVFDRIVTRATLSSISLSATLSATALSAWYGTEGQIPEDVVVEFIWGASEYFAVIDSLERYPRSSR